MPNFAGAIIIRELALFGSVLSDEFTGDSDVDILVEFEPGVEETLTLFDLAGMQIELSDIFQREVDLVIRESLKPLLKSNILESSETVYLHSTPANVEHLKPSPKIRKHDVSRN